MMSENDCSEKEFTTLVRKCNTMLKTRKEQFFDVAEFLMLADYYSEAGAPDETIQQLFDYAEKQHGANSDIEARKALFWLDCDREEEALQLLLRLADLEPENGFVAADLAFAYAHTGNVSSALFQLQRAISLNPDNEDSTVCYITEELVEHGHSAAAQKILRKTLQNFPDNSDLQYIMGRCYQEEGKTKKAIDVFKNVVRLDPYHFDAWFNLGVEQWNVEKFAEAIESLDYALAINPEFDMALFVKASCLQNMGKKEEAIQLYNEVLKINPENMGALELLARLYFEEENVELSEHCWQKLLDIDSTNAMAWAALARIKALNDDVEAATALFQKALEIDPDDTEIHADFAVLLSACGLHQEAITVCFNAVRVDAENTEIWLKFATILRNAGKPDKAIQVLQDALAYTKDAPIYYTLAELCVAQKKEKKALEYFQKGYEQNPDMAEMFFEQCNLSPEQLQRFHSLIFHTIIHTK